MAPATHCFAGLPIICVLMITSVVPIAEPISLKMVRRDAIDPTLFPKNLSNLERNQIFADLTYSRYSRLYTPHRVGPDAIRPRFNQFITSIFAVPFLVGSQNSGGYLLIDTGSDFTWVQCNGCDDCPELANPRYDRTDSFTYRPIPWNSPDCKTRLRIGNECKFNYNYLSGSIYGIKGIETFRFQSTDPVGFANVVLTFGCTLHMGGLNEMGSSYGEANVLAGLLGLAFTPTSFLGSTQAITQLKFSYCLPTWQTIDQHVEGVLTFGDDVPPVPPLARTVPLRPSGYFLNLLGLSVGSTRLNIDRDVFRMRPDGRGGTHIDSGSGFSVLPRAAFESVKAAYVEKLGAYGFRSIPPEQNPNEQMKLCYVDTFPPGAAASWMPKMTWHFVGADLEVDFWNVFNKFRKAGRPVIACMALIDGGNGAAVPTLLGAMQQADYRFWYDLRRATLSFIGVQCPGG